MPQVPAPGYNVCPPRSTADGQGKSMEEEKQKIRIRQHSCGGSVWFAGWLFSIGFLHLSFWKAIFALVLWPYYLGVHFSSWPH